MQDYNGAGGGNRQPQKLPVDADQHLLPEDILGVTQQIHALRKRPYRAGGEVVHHRDFEVIEVQWLGTARCHPFDEGLQFLVRGLAFDQTVNRHAKLTHLGG